MRIGELARRTELSASRIRFYEDRGLLPRAERSNNGYRDYPDSVVETLCLIRDAQTLGFSLGEIKAALQEAGASPPSKTELLHALRLKLTSLDRHIELVTLRRQRIVELIAELETYCR
jgi:MerR family copper efflux transcriptional regulator